MPERTVLVWRNDVLHSSETFIRNQVAATRGWRAVLTGARRRASVLSDTTDVILFGDTLGEKLRRRFFLTTGRSRRANALIRSRGVEVIHAHFATSAATILPVARRHGIPLIVTLHGFDVTNRDMRKGWAGARYVRRTRRVFRYASRIVAVSEFIADEAVAAFGADRARIRVLPIGVPVPAAPNVRTESRDVLFVGRLVAKKGVADLLAAVSRLRERGAQPSVAIVGDGPLRAALERDAIERGLAVDFLGALPPDDVAAEIAASRVVVAPSRTAPDGDAEGFGMVFLEAALAGAPVVAYRHGGVPEAVVDDVTGLLADEGDIDGLADAVGALLDDPDRRARMGAAAAARVRTEFDIARRTDRLVAEYDEVAAESRGREGRGAR